MNTFSDTLGDIVDGVLVAGQVRQLLARLSGVREAEHVVLAEDHARARLEDYRLGHLNISIKQLLKYLMFNNNIYKKLNKFFS